MDDPVTVVTTIDGLSDRLLPLEETCRRTDVIFRVEDVLPLEALSRKSDGAWGLKESVRWKVRASLRSAAVFLTFIIWRMSALIVSNLWGDEIDSITKF